MTDLDDDRHLDIARRLADGEDIDLSAEKERLDPELARGMDKLNRLIGRIEKQTDTAPHASAPEHPSSPPSPAPRSRDDRFIGDFRLVRKLGEGGMGVVYEAEQQRPKRPVALKVIRGGRHVDAHALRLFQREIQTLARLSHPGIAQLYETGVTDDGMHFFAMELIRGTPLSDWLKKRGDGPVTPAEMRIRLGVFRKICDAVAYAHQRGVIHRDLKPGNILIPTARAGSSMPDAVPEVKILDFGLARMTDTDVQMTTYVTEMGKVQGTLPYMSPEQVRGNPDEIDLRTDVYSLGVILYEMTTGKLPYDLSKVQIPEAIRIICEEPPRSLSATFTGTRRLDVDVATIAAKCLEKETARRYQSAAALGEDVQRYLFDQPILARPPSAAYQMKKLILRHKAPFAAAAGAFVLLIAFSIAMAVQNVHIARERDRANQERDRANREAETARRVSEFVDGMFKSADPWAPGNKNVSPKDILDRGAARLERDLVGEPGVQARLLRTIGVVYRGLGDSEKADLFLHRAVELARTALGSDSLEYADALNEVWGLENQELSNAIRSRRMAPDDPRLASGLWHLGVAQVGRDRPEAEETLRRGLDILTKSPERDRQLELYFYNDLGMARLKRGDFEGAVGFLRQSVRIREEIYPEDNPDRIMGLNNLGYALLLGGRISEARPLLEKSFELMTRYHPDHGLVPLCAQSLGELERRVGNLDRARSLLERSLERFDELDPDGSAIIDTLCSLGLLEETQGRLTEAIDHLARAHRLFVRESGVSTSPPFEAYARVLRKAGRLAEAELVERGSPAGSQAP